MPKLEKFKEKRYEKANNYKNAITYQKSYHFFGKTRIIIVFRFC